MSQYLPIGSFGWLNREEVSSLDILSLDNEADFSSILEDDLSTPDQLHDKLNDAEKLTIHECALPILTINSGPAKETKHQTHSKSSP